MEFKNRIKTLSNEQLEEEYSKILKSGAGTRQSGKTETRMHALKEIQKERKTDRERVIVEALALREQDKPLTQEVQEELRRFKITPKMLAEENKKRYQEKLARVQKNLPKDIRKSPDVVKIANF